MLRGLFKLTWLETKIFTREPAVHTISPWDNHEVVHVLTALIGRPTDFFNEGTNCATPPKPSSAISLTNRMACIAGVGAAIFVILTARPAPFTLLAALAVAAPQASCKPQFAPLTTGTYSGDSEVPFWIKEEAGDWIGDGWLGWSYRGDALEPVQFRVRARPKDNPEDEDEVTVQTTPQVTFAVRCIRGLRAGKIQNARVANYDLEYNGPLSISVGRRRYELRLETPDSDIAYATVVLSDGHRTQLLYTAGGFVDDPHFGIEWAGDLDRDGRLDLVVNLSRKYSEHPHRLLLSSRAARRELVGEAAVFTTLD